MPPPTNSSNNRTEDNARKRSEDPVHEFDSTSSSVQAQILLTALHNMIIPLVQTALPNQKDLHEVPFGREAEDFLAALQKYIASIIQDRSQSDSSVDGVKQGDKSEEPHVTPSKTQADEISGKELKANNKGSSPSGTGIKRTVKLEDKSVVVIPRSLNRQGGYLSQENMFNKALTVLRARVFNTMPIRLLRFEKHGSDLDITLVDRTEIYSDLIPKFRERFNSVLYDVTALSLFDQALLTSIYDAWVSEISQYTILSHTWLRSVPGEVTFSDWYHSDFDLAHPGYQKLVNFCRISAEEHQVTFGWMDTVCINKESSAELDESIRLMYKWYQNAKRCIVYLAETHIVAFMDEDPWFTRGWTLQELLAPRYIAFYNKRWMAMGNGLFNDKEDCEIQEQITSVTKITPTELMSPLSSIPISRKMGWAAWRKVTREEDVAYSLMGIFSVSISIAYGEGANLAFIRLIKEILTTAKSDVVDVFNWASSEKYDTNISSLLPPSPVAYFRRCEFDFGRITLIEPLTFTHLGLRIPVALMPAVRNPQLTTYTPKGDYSSTVHIGPVLREHDALRGSFDILGPTLFASPSFTHEDVPLGFGFAVLNCGGFDKSSILLYKRCFAVAILYSHKNGVVTPTGYKCKVRTSEPIVFELNNSRRTSEDDWEYDTVPKKNLARHGIQFLTMYL